MECFANHQILAAQYEADLCLHFEETTSEVFRFPNLLHWYSRPGMVKQQGIPPTHQLLRIPSLFFAGIPCEEFFANEVLLVVQ